MAERTGTHMALLVDLFLAMQSFGELDHPQTEFRKLPGFPVPLVLEEGVDILISWEGWSKF